MRFLTHRIDLSEVQRGDHVYALRKLGLYQHHGIVITAADATRLVPRITIDDHFMVVAQNRTGLEVVSRSNFADGHHLRRFQYNVSITEYRMKRSGSCSNLQRLPVEMIVENAMSAYNDSHEKEKWKTYSLRRRNCEHFAMSCCTEIGRRSEQILSVYRVANNALNTVIITGVPLITAAIKGLLRQVIRIGEKFVPSAISNLTITSMDELIKNCLPGNAITAAVAFAVELAFLTLRWIAYLCVRRNPDKCNHWLAAGYAIKTNEYVKCLIKAGISNATSFAFSIVGIIIGAHIPLPGATIGFSIFFGFVGYGLARWGSDWLTNWLERKIKSVTDDTKTDLVKF